MHYKGTENTIANTLSRWLDYKLSTKEVEPTILTTDNQGNIVYN